MDQTYNSYSELPLRSAPASKSSPGIQERSVFGYNPCPELRPDGHSHLEVLHGGRSAEEHQRQETPTINPIDRQLTRLTDKAPSTVVRAARETHNTNNTAAVHASALQQPAIIAPTQQGRHQILSANAARCEAKEQYTGGLSRTTP